MQLIQRLLKSTAEQDLVWRFFDNTVIRVADSVRFYREDYERECRKAKLIADAISRLCPDLTVLNGPFKGMRYPRSSACGSVLFPKLLGSYERELHPIVSALRNYRDIHDVGCAEGYYLIGLGMLNPNALLIGYDTNPRARAMCAEMGELNGVAGRLTVKKWCDGNFGFSTGDGLVICDVEGYEAQLFTKDVDAHLLIEIHDGRDPSIRTKVEAAFKGRDIQFIPAIPDAVKADAAFSELSAYSREEQTTLLAEERSRSTGWLWIQ